jgi:hypothetical protein
MSRLAALCATMAGVGGATALSVAPWFGRLRLDLRVGPYVSGAAAASPPATPPRTIASWATEPTLTLLSGALACTHRSGEADRVRVLSLTAGIVTLTASASALAIVGAEPWLAIPVLAVLPSLALAAPTLRARSEAERWRASVQDSLPELCERIAVLMGTGRSLTSALHTAASSMTGPIARDLGAVDARLALGHDVEQALRQWADRLRLPALDRLVAVLALHAETPDLGRLISREADAGRAEAHRDLLAHIDRRAEQVWIPVTIAALVPGAIFLLLPFFAALETFSAA